MKNDKNIRPNGFFLFFLGDDIELLEVVHGHLLSDNLKLLQILSFSQGKQLSLVANNLTNIVLNQNERFEAAKYFLFYRKV